VALLFFIVRVGFGQWRTIASTAIIAAAGATATLAALAFINRMYGGSWLFLAASFNTARYVASTPSPWRAVSWQYRAAWLTLPATAALGAAVSLLRPSRSDFRFPRALQVAALTAVAGFTALELRGMPVLQFSYYSSYLVPLSLLAMIALALPPREETGASMSMPATVVPPLATLLVFVAAHWLFLTRSPNLALTISRLPVARRAYDLLWFGPFGLESFSTFLALAGGLAALSFIWLVRPGSLRWYGFAAGLAVGCAAIPVHWPAAGARGVQATYAEVVSADRFVDRHVADRTLRFWYDATSPNRPFRSISSTYFWSYTLLNEQMPRLTADEAATLPPNTRFVLLVPVEADVLAARRSLQKYGLDLSLIDQHRFGTDDRELSVVIADLIHVSETTTR
jgi:hypothetical protein